MTTNEELCLPHGYCSRNDPPAWDDTPFKDEFQDAVYRRASRLLAEHHFIGAFVCDFGCGSGWKLQKYFMEEERFGYEVRSTLDYLTERWPIEAKQGRWRHCDDPIESCDLLICADVIEHVPDPLALLRRFAESEWNWLVISTPALELLADRGLSTLEGPPFHEPHRREWTTRGFGELIARYFEIIEHTVASVTQCCQMVVAQKR